MDKASKKGKLKTHPIEQLRERLDELLEERMHFPRNFFWWLRKLRTKIADRFYYYKCYFFHPYNKLKVKTLPPTWVDRDHFLLHACFTIFCSVIEDEKLLNRVLYDHTKAIEKLEKETWDDEERRKEAVNNFKKRHELDQKLEKELKHLYNWWKVLRPEREKEINNSSNWDDLEKEEKAYKEDTEHLIRLIKIRGSLWT